MLFLHVAGMTITWPFIEAKVGEGQVLDIYFLYCYLNLKFSIIKSFFLI